MSTKQGQEITFKVDAVRHKSDFQLALHTQFKHLLDAFMDERFAATGKLDRLDAQIRHRMQ